MTREKELFDALLQGDTEKVRALLTPMPFYKGLFTPQLNINHYQWINGAFCTPLHIAVQKGFLELAKLFIEKGAKVNPQEHHCPDLLKIAVNNEDIPMATLLLEKGVKVSQLTEERRGMCTPLYKAVEKRHLPLITLLLQHNADIAIGYEENRADGKAVISSLEKALHIGEPAIIQLFLKELTGKNYQRDVKATLLSTALNYATAQFNHSLAVTLLQIIKAESLGDKYFYTDRFGYHHKESFDWQPFCTAAATGQSDLMKLMLGYGATVQFETKKGQTALHYASASGKLEIVQFLLESNIPVNAYDIWGQTALHLAATNDNLEVKRTLLAHGANPLLTTSSHETAYDIALRYKLGDEHKLLLLSHYPQQELLYMKEKGQISADDLAAASLLIISPKIKEEVFKDIETLIPLFSAFLVKNNRATAAFAEIIKQSQFSHILSYTEHQVKLSDKLIMKLWDLYKANVNHVSLSEFMISSLALDTDFKDFIRTEATARLRLSGIIPSEAAYARVDNLERALFRPVTPIAAEHKVPPQPAPPFKEEVVEQASFEKAVEASIKEEKERKRRVAKQEEEAAPPIPKGIEGKQEEINLPQPTPLPESPRARRALFDKTFTHLLKKKKEEKATEQSPESSSESKDNRQSSHFTLM